VSLRLVFVPAALAELSAASEWYEHQRPGLGGEFIEAAEAAMARAAEAPLQCPREPDVPARLNLRRAQVHGFPYSVTFQVRPDRLRVLAFAHHARVPGYWTSRLAE
jgi:toxin ParE1/3/4